MNEIQSLFPAVFATSFIKIDSEKSYSLTEEEIASLSGVSDKRRLEFAAGRFCARQALALLGVNYASIPLAADRAPIWPAGTVGSISHTKDTCAVVVSRTEHCDAVGLDIEQKDRLEQKYWKKVFLHPEIEFLQTQVADSERVANATLMFGVKEAFYKFQYPQTGEFLGFHDAEVSIVLDQGIFSVKVLKALKDWKKGDLFYGSYKFFDRYVACGLWSK